ncbi:MAG: hypothetical protein U1E73_13440 [Planctomycetota bacterium]
MSGSPLLSRLLGGAVAVLLALISTSSAAPAQAITREEFATGFLKGLELGDPKLMDQWMKKPEGSTHALQLYEGLAFDRLNRPDPDGKVQAKMDALRTSFERCFEDRGTVRRVQRWVEGTDATIYDSLEKGRSGSTKLWRTIGEMQQPTREELLAAMDQFLALAQNARTLGHMCEVADLCLLAAVVGNRVNAKEKTLEDRKRVLAAYEEFVAAREAWEYTCDQYYIGAKQFVKDEKTRIAEDEKLADKRKSEGYGDNAKGVESLLMPTVAEAKILLEYKPLQTWDDLDYGPKNGPVPPLWWLVSLGKEGEARQFSWFKRRDMWLVRTGAAKFGISLTEGDTKNVVEIAASSKPKPSAFWLDADHKVPYSMFFWTGSDRERIGEAEQNVMPSTDVAQVYYRSAASWQADVEGETAVFYDDSANGQPCDPDAWELGYKVYTLGNYDGQDAGTPAPLLDSMKIGKGPRVPFSEFVKIGDKWVYVQRKAPDQIGVRPLNPEYFKTGKVKLVWSGPKPTAPVQLVVQGKGDYKSAYFDLASGKEVELPVGEWTVIFGRIVNGKGVRAQTGTLYQGDSKPFVVEEGKTTALAMGAPFDIAWHRHGDQNISIDALQIFVKEASGCLITELQAMAVVPEVLAAKDATGKGAKPVGKFLPFNDGELVLQAQKAHPNLSTLCALFPMPQGYTKGAMSLALKLPSDGMKVGLVMKKHPLFGALGPIWQ